MTHIHKYKKKIVGRNKYAVYQCVIPRCSHFLQPAFIEGKESVCWGCDKSFIISRVNNNLSPSQATTKPVCGDCKSKRSRKTDKRAGITIDQMLSILESSNE